MSTGGVDGEKVRFKCTPHTKGMFASHINSSEAYLKSIRYKVGNNCETVTFSFWVLLLNS